jgi:hypothetical protein
MIRVAAILMSMVFAGCGAVPSQELQTVDLGAQFTLAPGATVFVKNAGIKVRFIAVIEDSRCPLDVTCIWAGEVKVQLEIDDTRATSPLEIIEGGSAAAGGYRVTVVRVEPQPVSTARIAPQAYRVTLTMDKD